MMPLQCVILILPCETRFGIVVVHGPSNLIAFYIRKLVVHAKSDFDTRGIGFLSHAESPGVLEMNETTKHNTSKWLFCCFFTRHKFRYLALLICSVLTLRDGTVSR